VLICAIMLVSITSVIAWNPNPTYDPFEVLWNAVNATTTSWTDGLGKVTTNVSVGIGTDNPEAELHLEGNAKVSPKFLPNHTAEYSNGTFEVTDVFVLGDYAYVCDFGNLKIFDVSNASNPLLVSITAAGCMDLFVAGGYAYLAEGSANFLIYDVTDPAAPTQIGEYYDEGAMSVHVLGKYAYVGDSQGLSILDVSNPQSPQLVGQHYAEGGFTDVYVVGRYAYAVANYYPTGFQIIDVLNVGSPVGVGNYTQPFYDMTSVYVSGQYAYVTAYLRGLLILDISNPQSPTLAGYYNSSTGESYDVFVSGDYALFADGTNGFYIINVSDKQNLDVAYTYDTPGENESMGVYLSGENAYVADHYALQIFQVFPGGNLEAKAVHAESFNLDNIVINKDAYIGDSLIVGNYLGVGLGGLSVLGTANLRNMLVQGNVSIGTAPGDSRLSVGGDNEPTAAIYGSGISYGVYGRGSTGVSGWGDYLGVYGLGDMYGLYGSSNNYGVCGGGDYGVLGRGSQIGVAGIADWAYTPIVPSKVGVYGAYNQNNYGYLGGNGTGVFGNGTQYGGYFVGKVNVEGDLVLKGQLIATNGLNVNGKIIVNDIGLLQTTNLDSDNFDVQKGYLILGTMGTNSCNNVCANHSLSCYDAFTISGGPATCSDTALARYCWCT